MTLTLILMRHAKSGWDDPTLDDIDRPLSDRGRRQAPLIGRWLASAGHIPDLALVSGARRTRETWDLMAGDFPDATPRVVDALYLAPPARIRAALNGETDKTILVLAHNPGIAEAAHDMVEHHPEDGDFMRYPTSATSVIRFDADRWDDVRRGRLVDFTVPRRLEA